MNIILIEETKYDVGSFMKKLNNKYPVSSRITLNRNNYINGVKAIQTRPLLTKEWLVVFGEDVPIKVVASIFSNPKNVNVFLLSSDKNLEDIKVELHSLKADFKILNNLHPPKSEIIEYVMTHLDVSYVDAKYICSRHKYYIPTIVNSVYILSTFDHVDRNIIKTYTKRFGNVSFYSITESLLGVSDIKREKVVELVYNYRYGFDFLLKYIKKDLAHYRLIFELIGEGLLTLDNYTSLDLKDKRGDEFNKIKKFQVRKIIELYSKISIGYLYFIQTAVNEIKPRYTNIYKLILLLK